MDRQFENIDTESTYLDPKTYTIGQCLTLDHLTSVSLMFIRNAATELAEFVVSMKYLMTSGLLC